MSPSAAEHTHALKQAILPLGPHRLLRSFPFQPLVRPSSLPLASSTATSKIAPRTGRPAYRFVRRRRRRRCGRHVHIRIAVAADATFGPVVGRVRWRQCLREITHICRSASGRPTYHIGTTTTTHQFVRQRRERRRCHCPIFARSASDTQTRACKPSACSCSPKTGPQGRSESACASVASVDACGGV